MIAVMFIIKMQVDYTKGIVDHQKLSLNISCTQPGKTTEAKWDEDRVKERVLQTGTYLIVYKPGNIPYDQSWNSGNVNTYTSKLNPRVEIVTKYGIIPKNIPINMKYTFRVPKADDFYAVIFQVMDR